MIMSIYGTSFPMIFSVVVLLVCIMHIFAIAGIHFFPFIKWGEGINQNANFGSYFNTIVTLIRISTTESWNKLLEDMVRKLRPNHVCYEINTYREF